MDLLLDLIKNISIFENNNFKKSIDKLIIDNIDYNIIINEFDINAKEQIFIGEINENIIYGLGFLILKEFILIKGIFNTKENIQESEVYINNELLYKGNIISGKFNGKCNLYYKNEIVYSGNIENNIPNCSNCLFINSNGNRYIGVITNGIIEGIGTMTYSLNNKYEGEFLNNNKHGKGIFYKEDNIIIEGSWYNDKEKGIMKVIKDNIIKFIEYNDGIIIKEFSQEEYTINKLNKELEIIKIEYDDKIKDIKQQNQNEIKNIIEQNKNEINKIKKICDRQIKNLEEHYETKLNEDKEKKLCKICHTNEADIVFDTCNHIVICKNCEINLRRTSRFNKCPICRTTYLKGKQIKFS
jgi:hypothetical protein